MRICRWIFDVDITKLADTNNIGNLVILTFDCDTPNIPNETLGFYRDNIPDYFDIKKEVIVNLYEDKRTVRSKFNISTL